MVKEFLKKFDTQRFITVGKFIFILASIVVIINLSQSTFSRYESNATINAEANVAFFIVDEGSYEGSIALDGLTPSSTPFYYQFYVRNHDGNGNIAQVDLNYTIEIETTTNLPLTFEVVEGTSFGSSYTNLLGTSTSIQDDYNVFYNSYPVTGTYSFNHSVEQEDIFTIKVVFPESYKNSPNDYQGIIDLFSIKISATQVA